MHVFGINTRTILYRYKKIVQTPFCIHIQIKLDLLSIFGLLFFFFGILRSRIPRIFSLLKIFLSFEKEILPPLLPTPCKKLVHDPRARVIEKNPVENFQRPKIRQARSARLQERCCNPRCNELTIFLPTQENGNEFGTSSRPASTGSLSRWTLCLPSGYSYSRDSLPPLFLPPSPSTGCSALFLGKQYSPVYRERTALPSPPSLSLLSSPRF